ncbi:hypothetical protein [Thermostaphylospora chromogena]|uniref:Lipoprotein n=1 Tax=Thermostaphylospora chromogena TaxID=35622 RepID=A0A1H1DTI2_9ACTN|nr:hypothetical protein [Thermostaphylospora chromogena]SDQ79548.1 hypothetical protein SAMN04489764_2153 [Thermostaphylospora chromogena]
MRESRATRRIRATAALGFTLLSAVACGVGEAEDGDAAPPRAAQAPPAESGPPPTVEQLAAKTGCTPKIQVDTPELRTGYCKTRIGEFFLSTFATEQGKDEWMDVAPEYSPHLVGRLWAALADPEVLGRLQDVIGGDLHMSDHRVSLSPSPTR